MAFRLLKYVPLLNVEHNTKFMVVLGGVVVFGIGLELNGAMCSAGIYLCIACYATSKLLIYSFLSAFSDGLFGLLPWY
jgi:hypothetical protein